MHSIFKRLLPLALICFGLLFPALGAQADGFQEDLAGINQAAQSVLMLYVFDEENNLLGTGSGFVAFDNRTLVTNYHVIEGADSILATSDDGYDYHVAYVLAADEAKDIALLAFYSPTNLTPLAFHPGEMPLRGAPVVAIGSPEGLQNTVSFGNISGYPRYDDLEGIQFTAPISHGSSGGALFDNEGKVLGITSASLVEGQNLNYAIPIKYIEALHKTIPLGFKGMWFEEFFAPQATPTPKPTPEPTVKPTPIIPPAMEANCLTAKKAGYYSVKLSWNYPSTKSNKPITFYIGYRRHGEEEVWYYTHTVNSVANLSYTVENLIPGETYAFYVSTDKYNIRGSNATVNHRISKQESWQAGLTPEPDYLGLSYCKLGADFFNASREKSPKCTRAELAEAGKSRDYYLVYAFDSNRLKRNMSTRLLFVIYTPNGDAYPYAGFYTLDKGSTGYKLSNCVTSFFAKYLDTPYPLGTYKLEAYMDGRLAYEGAFEVTQ